jgi:hypothetical protein
MMQPKTWKAAKSAKSRPTGLVAWSLTRGKLEVEFVCAHGSNARTAEGVSGDSTPLTYSSVLRVVLPRTCAYLDPVRFLIAADEGTEQENEHWE